MRSGRAHSTIAVGRVGIDVVEGMGSPQGHARVGTNRIVVERVNLPIRCRGVVVVARTTRQTIHCRNRALVIPEVGAGHGPASGPVLCVHGGVEPLRALWAGKRVHVENGHKHVGLDGAIAVGPHGDQRVETIADQITPTRHRGGL